MQQYRTVVALLLACAVSLSFAQGPLWADNATVSTSAPFNSTFGPFNLHTTATLSFSYNHLIQLCIVYADFGLPHWTQYSAENCLIYFNATKEGEDSIADLQLLQAKYQIGVFFANPLSKDNTTIQLHLTGEACSQQDQYWDGANCVQAVAKAPSNETWHEDYAKGETKFYTYTTGVGLSHFAFSISGVETDQYVVYARYNGVPSAAIHDKTDNATGTLKVVAPRQGNWVLYVHAIAAFSTDFSLTEFACGDKSAGEGCTIPVREPFTNTSITITPEDGWMYLRFTVDDKQPLLVSITTNNGSNIPYIYASRGQIPVPQTGGGVLADIHNCNREYCDVVRSIVRNITLPAASKRQQAPPEDWYIAIFSTVPGNTTFALWWNSTCVPNCDTDNHGECLDSGRCLCEIDYEGVDCSVSKGLGPQYIVLIIIASLVVASAIIGFVAWAYMRRKRNNYEIVS